MKKIRIATVAATCFLTGATLNAQTLYDADRLMGSDLNGTARFVSMGGAMGALGGDISTIGTNPAGIGIYRSNDAMISFGLVNTGSKSTFDKNTIDTEKSYGSFDNIGFVLSNKIGDLTLLKYINIGFNYRKLKSFDKNMSAEGGILVSQTQQFKSMVNNSAHYGIITPDELMSKDAFTLNFVPWLGVMAHDANLIAFDENEELYQPYLLDDNTVFSEYSSKERGGVDSYDMNIALNFYDRFYLGATLGAYSVDYTRHTSYSETFYVRDTYTGGDDGSYTLHNNYALEGSGIDFKLGVIVRPIETSSLRIGVAIHTPTWYQLKENHFARLNYRTYTSAGEPPAIGETFPQSANGNPMEGKTEYRITTPWKYNLSLGYTISRNIAVGAEYEYSDHSSSTLRYDDGVKMEETNAIGEGLKGVHTIRAGAEFKLAPEFSFRLGYNHITASLYKDTFKNLPVNTIRTDTEFSNIKAVNNYTLGVGYRSKNVYVDMAYLYNSYKEDFYAFDHIYLPATKVANSNHKLMFTLGLHF
jgi:long-subunit fatty acid transport protein